LVAQDFQARVLHGLAKLAANSDQIVGGMGTSLRTLGSTPAKFLGCSLAFFGFQTEDAGRSRVNGKRVRQHKLDIPEIAKTLWLAQRHNLRRRKFPIPAVEAIDPKVQVILQAVDPSRGPSSVMDVIATLLDELDAA